MVIVNEGLRQQQSIAVGAAAVVELSAEKCNTKRIELIITNTSTLNQVITLGVGQNAAAGVGIVLYAGSSYIAAIDARYRPTNDRITAIASAAAGSVAYFERCE